MRNLLRVTLIAVESGWLLKRVWDQNITMVTKTILCISHAVGWPVGWCGDWGSGFLRLIKVWSPKMLFLLYNDFTMTRKDYRYRNCYEFIRRSAESHSIFTMNKHIRGKEKIIFVGCMKIGDSLIKREAAQTCQVNLDFSGGPIDSMGLLEMSSVTGQIWLHKPPTKSLFKWNSPSSYNVRWCPPFKN